jgi:sporulation protein YlmC with PRC-barrel domain
MLRSVQELHGYAIRATDGIIGHVKDIYFDDQKWVVRYFVVETGSWLSSRKVLISPIAIGKPNWAERVLPASITKEQVKNSPDIDADKPVSRQHEMQYLAYYGYPYYWGGPGLWASAYPGGMLTGVGYDGSGADYLVAQADHARAEAAAQRPEDRSDPYLRSCNALLRYHIEATDGGMGQVQGLLVDEETWAIRYLIVETSNWWFGHQVLIAPQWIEEMSWPDATITVNLTRQAVKDAPPYDSSVPLDRDQELRLHQHHGRDGYWAEEVRLESPEDQVITPAAPGTIAKTRGGVMQDKRHSP